MKEIICDLDYPKFPKIYSNSPKIDSNSPNKDSGFFKTDLDFPKTDSNFPKADSSLPNVDPCSINADSSSNKIFVNHACLENAQIPKKPSFFQFFFRLFGKHSKSNTEN